MVKVKICGITNLKDAKVAVQAGCHALGFVFYKKSPRYIVAEEAKKIIKKIPRGIIKIGVFVNEGEKEIKRIARLCHLDMLQFHGNESPDFCHKFKGYKIIKAFRIKDKVNLAKISRYHTFAYLFDTFVRSRPGGGTGARFNWGLLRYLEGLKQPIFLSGGLNLDNVQEAIKAVYPDWVDVSSSVECRPGKKDRHKVRKFIKVIKLRAPA